MGQSRRARLLLTVDAVAVQLEAGVVEHKVDAAVPALESASAPRTAHRRTHFIFDSMFQIRSMWLPRMFFSVAARCSPPVLCRFLMSSSVMLMSRLRSVALPQRHTCVSSWKTSLRASSFSASDALAS